MQKGLTHETQTYAKETYLYLSDRRDSKFIQKRPTYQTKENKTHTHLSKENKPTDKRDLLSRQKKTFSTDT